jgi:hypothetical protein
MRALIIPRSGFYFANNRRSAAYSHLVVKNVPGKIQDEFSICRTMQKYKADLVVELVFK